MASLSNRYLLVVDPGVIGQFGQVTAQQAEVMSLVDTANAPQGIDRRFVVQVAHQRVAGISRNGGNATFVQNFRSLLQQPNLGMLG